MSGEDSEGLVDHFLSPVVSFGRWSEYRAFLVDRSDEISKQALLYVFFHWKLSTTFARSQPDAPSFSENEDFTMKQPQLVSKPTAELFAKVCYDQGRFLSPKV